MYCVSEKFAFYFQYLYIQFVLIKDNGFYINNFILWCKAQGPAWKMTYAPEVNSGVTVLR